MEISRVVVGVFFVLAMAILAAILYNLFFSYPDGSLWHLTRSIQSPMSAYYYRYCYIPNIHQTDAIDESLGIDILYDYESTPYDIENTDTVSCSGSSYFLYSTGWE